MKDFLQLTNIFKIFSEEQTQQKTAAVDGVSLNIEKGEFFTLLGPSGCGKTTTLRIIAGFIEPDSGEVLINGERITHKPPNHRPVHTVFQNYALFPHMTIEENIAYGLRISKIPGHIIEQKVKSIISLVRLQGMENRKPSQLSGGQQQRVALARAIVNEPFVLLLDEPLGALDLKLRKEMQWELKRIQKSTGITFVYVTHDQEEALTMSDRIAVMDAGKIVQIGTPRNIYTAPNSYFVANFIGNTNFLKIEIVDRKKEECKIKLAGQIFSFSCNKELTKDFKKTFLSIRPELISFHPSVSEPAKRITLNARVVSSVFIGSDTRFLLELQDNQKIQVLVRNSTFSQAITKKEVEIGFSAADAVLF